MITKQYFGKSIISNDSGFTITEVLITVSIIGILAVTFIGSYVAMRPTLNMHSYGRDLIGAAQMAKLEAVKRNTCVGIAMIVAAAPPADLTGVANRGSYWVFTDDGEGGGTACDAIMQLGERNHPQFPARQFFVPQGVALTQSPAPITLYNPGPPESGDPNYRAPGPPPDTDLFDTVSFNSRAMIENTTWPTGRAIVLRNDPNPANATWWGRVIVNSLGGAMEYQTNNLPANEINWSEQ